MGIIFIDEIDKVATNNSNSGQDVSRQGVKEIYYQSLKVA